MTSFYFVSNTFDSKILNILYYLITKLEYNQMYVTRCMSTIDQCTILGFEEFNFL